LLDKNLTQEQARELENLVNKYQSRSESFNSTGKE